MSDAGDSSEETGSDWEVETDFTCANSHLLELLDARLSIFLSPAYLGKLEEGIHRELNLALLRYLEDHEAILLAYHKLRLADDQAMLGPANFPYMNIQVDAELLLFKPAIGQILVGTVRKMAGGVLGVLALGGMNAQVPFSEMPSGWVFDKRNKCLVPDKDYSRAILMGDVVAVRML
eukprot:gene8377-8561_t